MSQGGSQTLQVKQDFDGDLHFIDVGPQGEKFKVRSILNHVASHHLVNLDEGYFIFGPI